MRIKVLPEDFVVKEVLAVPLAEGGRYAVYRTRKRAITTLQLQNRLAGRYLQARLETEGVPFSTIEIAGQALPVYGPLPEHLLASLRDVKLPLLHHRVQSDDPMVASLVEAILRQEGFRARDLKARVLKKAYLGKGCRALLLLPQDLAWGEVKADERFPGRRKLTVRFFLPRGSYATLLFKAVGG